MTTLADERGHILMANRAAEIIFGYDGETRVSLWVDAPIATVRRAASVRLTTGFDPLREGRRAPVAS